jgi:predicted DNA-binding transcriptional regulator AlpA
MLLTADQVAELLGLHPVYVRDVVSKRKGFPDARRFGKALRWDSDEIDDWIDKQRVSPTVRARKAA